MHILIHKHKPLSIGFWHLEEIIFEWNMHRNKLYSARVGDDLRWLKWGTDSLFTFLNTSKHPTPESSAGVSY